MNTTTNAVVSTHYNIAELIAVFGGWTVNVVKDDVGLYISMANPDNADDHRGLSLTSDEESEDMSEYRWQFWNETQGTWFESELDAAADAESVLGFLKDCLAEERISMAVGE